MRFIESVINAISGFLFPHVTFLWDTTCPEFESHFTSTEGSSDGFHPPDQSIIDTWIHVVSFEMESCSAFQLICPFIYSSLPMYDSPKNSPISPAIIPPLLFQSSNHETIFLKPMFGKWSLNWFSDVPETSKDDSEKHSSQGRKLALNPVMASYCLLENQVLPQRSASLFGSHDLDPAMSSICVRLLRHARLLPPVCSMMLICSHSLCGELPVTVLSVISPLSVLCYVTVSRHLSHELSSQLHRVLKVSP